MSRTFKHKNIMDFVLTSGSSYHLAKFGLVVGKAWTGEGGGGLEEGVSRTVHVEMVRAASRHLPSYVDMIMIPEGDQVTLGNITSFLYTGR